MGAKVWMAIVGLIVGAMVVVAVVGSRSPGRDGGVRIVVLSPALAITLVDLGMEDRIVGRHGFDYVLDKALPVCGDQSGIDYEALIRVRPTDIVIEWGKREMPARLIELAKEHGWAIHDFELLTLEEIGASVVELSRVFDVHPRVEVLRGAAEITASQVVDRMIGDAKVDYRGRVLLMWPSSPPAAVGPGSFHQELLERLGGVPAITEGAPFIELDVEDVLRMAPDAIVLVSPREVGEGEREYSWAEIEGMLGAVAKLGIGAVEERRVGVLDDPLVLTPSTAVIGYGKELREVIEGLDH